MARITQDVDPQGPDPHAVRVLYEREEQLEALARVREDAARGEGRMLCLRGEAGVGKTELLLDCAGAARAAGLTVCQARAGEFERSWAFGVARHLLDRLAAEVDQTIVLSGAGAIARSLLEPQAAGAPAPDASFAVMHGLYWACVNASGRRPLLLAVDDAHWADDPSLRWLAFLGRRLPGHPIGVVITLRPEDVHSDSGLAELLGEIGTGAVTVPPLSPTATLAITHDRFGASAPEAFAHACHRVTGGNPFFLRELHRALLAEGVPATPTGADRVGEIAPRGVTDAVLARLARLGSRVLEIARSLAVLGDGAPVEDLAGVAGVAVSEAIEALDTLVREGLVVGDDGASFSHPIVRAALYRELTPFGRTQRHGRAAEVLEHAGRPANRVVAQLQRAEPVGADWAIERLRQAAADAAARGAPDLAAQFLERALRESLGAERRSGLLLELGRVEVLARSSGALEHLREAFELAPDPTIRAEAAVALATALVFAGQAQEATGFAREVQEQLGVEQPEQVLQLEALTLAA
jgi:AAA ATPase domain